MATDPATRRRRGRSGWRSLVRAVSWHRRLVAAACAAVAVTAALQAVSPPPPERVPVVVAAAVLPGGRVLGPDDLTVRGTEPDAVPRQAVADPAELVGRRLAAPVGEGEPVTTVRLVGSSLLADYAVELGPSAVVTPVRVADAGPLVLLRPGDRVDVLAAPLAGAEAGPAAGGPAAGGPARVVVARAPVLAIEPTAPGTDEDPLGAGDPAASGTGLLVLATTSRSALELAGAAAGSAMSVVVHPAG